MQVAVADALHESPSIPRRIRECMAAYGIAPRRLRLQKGRLFALSSGSRCGLHVLVAGHLKLLRFSDDGRVILMDLLDVGEVFGEASVLGTNLDGQTSADGGEQTTYVQALTEATIESLSPLVAERLLTRDAGLTLSLARLVSQRRGEIERRLLTQVFDRVPIRLAERLLALADRYGVPEPGTGGYLLSVILSQQDLANWIGASREIVSLTLSEFRRLGAVRKRGRALVLHPVKLRKIEAGGRS